MYVIFGSCQLRDAGLPGLLSQYIHRASVRYATQAAQGTKSKMFSSYTIYCQLSLKFEVRRLAAQPISIILKLVSKNNLTTTQKVHMQILSDASKGPFTQAIFVAATRCNFCRAQGCKFKIARVNQVRFLLRFVAAIS